MITYYAATGRMEIERRYDAKQPTIYKEGEAHDLNVYEFTLWTLIAWNILNQDELSKEYQKKCRELRLFDDQPFNHVLSRLEQRGLVASGMAYTAQDAMYELICKLRIHPIRVHWFGKAAALVLLFLRHNLSLRGMLRLLKPYPLSSVQKSILTLTEQVLLTPAELIKCMEKGVVRMPSEDKLIDTVYQDNYNYDNLHNDTRFSCYKSPVMKAVVDLFLNKQIIFE